MWWTYVATLTSFFSLRIVFQFEKREKNDFLQRNTEYLLLYARSHKLQWPLPICLRMKKTGVCYSIKRITLGWTEREREIHTILCCQVYMHFLFSSHIVSLNASIFILIWPKRTNERTRFALIAFPSSEMISKIQVLIFWIVDFWQKKREKSTKSSRKSQSHPMHKYRGKNIHDGINECQRTGQS